MKSVIALAQIFLVLISAQAQADLSVCPRMPTTAGAANQFVSAISAAGAVTLASPTVVTAPPSVQTFTSGSGTYNKNYTFVITSGSATVGATYTNNAITYTVWATVASATQVVMNGSGAPASSGTLTKASGTGDATLTFSQVLAPLYLHVRAVGGGGGGSGGQHTVGAANGSAGTATTFGSSLITANGGTGGLAGSATSVAGGSGTVSSPAYGVGVAGGRGGGGMQVVNVANVYVSGAVGGASCLGGNGAPGGANQVPGAGAANTGGGGGGGSGTQSASGAIGGGGGGAGGCAIATIPSPSATYAYAVGPGGAGGALGTTGDTAGADGGSGVIVVTEYYQ